MPTINLENLSTKLNSYEIDLTRRIVNTRTGELRASKPTIAKKVRVADPNSDYGYRYTYQTDEQRRQGEAAYIWRMVAFFVSKNPVHHCMPITADFDLDGSVRECHIRAKELDKLVDIIVDTIPKASWHGVRRWSQAFGQTGTPQLNEEGAIIYR
jgi:hypothetical protein